MENKKAKILVVDDEPDIVDTLKEYLGTRGYHVIGALSGEDAIKTLEKERADLILMDIMMPGMKGTEAARVIKSKYPDIKVLILTGYPKETESLVTEHMLEGIFTKPVGMRELYDKLSELINPVIADKTATSHKTGVKARVLLLKANLIFLEPSASIYRFLTNHFLALSKKGEEFRVEQAADEETALLKMPEFKPDLLLVNASFVRQNGTEALTHILDAQNSFVELIVYNIPDADSISSSEVDKITRTVEANCFKHGLIEVKWVEL